MGVLAGDDAEDAEGGGDGVAAALDGQLDDVLGVEVGGVLGEAGAGGVLDALVDGEDRQVAGAGQAAGAEEALEVDEDPGVAVAGGEDAVDEIGAGEVERLLGDGLADVLQQAVGLGAKKLANGGRHGWRLSDSAAAPWRSLVGGGRRQGSAC